ncbi:MAG TPA: TetR/AcrR family transcriptional regulator [Pseudonocardiaceae bacterium]
MTDDVKPRRAYNARGRRDQAEANRRAVLDVAREMFVEHGYATVSIAAVARAAGVSPETIYKTIGPKSALLKTVSDVSIAGDDEPGSLEAREYIQRTIAEPDPVIKVDRYATLVANLQPSHSPISRLARQAAMTDPDAAEVWATMNAERLTGATRFIEHLHENRLLRKDISVEQAADLVWTYNSLEVYELLVLGRGWSMDAYRDFISKALIAALLP